MRWEVRHCLIGDLLMMNKSGESVEIYCILLSLVVDKSKVSVSNEITLAIIK